MTDEPKGCARVTGAVLGTPAPEPTAAEPNPTDQQEETMTARVGYPAPDFNAPAYHRGGFTQVQLSDHLGTWVLLCFYPGDFTFV